MERSLLIIDDETRMTQSLSELLKASGYQPATANSGAAAIEILSTREFPVVVTDLRMQGVDGLDVIRHLHEHHPRTLVIVITGYASADSAIEALHYHAFDYLRKPFEFDDLKHAIDRAFHRIELERLREDTAAMITHDIKAPLTSIIGFATLMTDPKSGELTPKAGEYAEVIRSNGQKVLALIDNYLTQFKVEMGRLKVNPREVRVSEFIESLIEVFGSEARGKGFTINVSIDPALPEKITIDEHLAFRAMGNLLQNAIKYGKNSAPIGIEVKADGGGVILAITNAAPELHPDELPQLFGRFTRSASRSGIEGSGIGLYVVDQVARAHGGEAHAEMLEDHRVKFSISLPKHVGADAVIA